MNIELARVRRSVESLADGAFVRACVWWVRACRPKALTIEGEVPPGRILLISTHGDLFSILAAGLIDSSVLVVVGQGRGGALFGELARRLGIAFRPIASGHSPDLRCSPRRVVQDICDTDVPRVGLLVDPGHRSGRSGAGPAIWALRSGRELHVIRSRFTREWSLGSLRFPLPHSECFVVTSPVRLSSESPNRVLKSTIQLALNDAEAVLLRRMSVGAQGGSRVAPRLSTVDRGERGPVRGARAYRRVMGQLVSHTWGQTPVAGITRRSGIGRRVKPGGGRWRDPSRRSFTTNECR